MSPARRALPALAIALATSLALPCRAQETAPPAIRTAPEARCLYLGSRAEAEFSPGGRGLALGFDLEPAGALRLGRTSLEAGLLSRPGGEGEGTLAPFAGLSWGWPLRLYGALALIPSATFRVLAAEGKATWNLGLALPLEFRLAGRQYLRLCSRADYFPATQAFEAGFGLGIRLEGGLARRRGPATEEAGGPPAPGDVARGGPAAVATASNALGDAVIPAAREAPTLGLACLPEAFSPDGDGEADEAEFRLSAGPYGDIASWELRVLSPDGSTFRSWAGHGAPPASLRWDGRSGSGELVESALDYPVRALVRDAAGAEARAEAGLGTGVLVIKEGDAYRIRIASIVFDADSGALGAEGSAGRERNRLTLERLAAACRRYPSYAIKVEGHGNLVNWADPAAAAAEQSAEVLPLSLARARAVKAALVALGIEPGRISVSGVGAARPLVPFSDPENWRNRRVEFYLTRR